MDSGLNAIAGYLRQNYPKFTYFYLGSGKFILQAPESADLKEVQENLLSRFNRSWNGNNAKLYLQVGFITVNSRQSFDSDEQFLDCLHSTFQQADNITRNNCLMIDEEHKKAREHYLDMKRSVENAIKKSDVLLYLQPIIDASTGKLAGAEVLARLNDPKLGMIMPSDFISLAEENGSILTMGEQIFRKACEFMVYYGKQISLPWINVNLSPIQCLDLNLPEEFYNIIKKYNLTPDQIRLEITEGENIDYNLLQQQIHSMEEKGFSFILDDYGTGYSNISRAIGMPLSIIKLDKSLTKIEDNMKLISIGEHTIRMIKDMDMEIVAEGIEDEKTLKKFEEMGCDFIQGYYFSRPLPKDQFIAFVREKNSINKLQLQDKG
jgi:EAL domain-containing protein (putative c-di-GMP-specific phosphodiesterase class I)